MIEISESIPRVSVIMTVYNTEFSKVRRALDSVLRQDFRDIETIIVDDGSDPDTGKKILDYIAGYKERFIYVRQTNQGQALAANRGIINSKGRYVGFIDSDDEYKPNHVSECVKQIETGFDLIASVTETIVNAEDDYYVPDKDNENIDVHIDDCIVFGTLFGSREVFLNLGFKPLYSLDGDFFQRASRSYNTKKLNLRTYIYHRDSIGSIVANKKKNRKI